MSRWRLLNPFRFPATSIVIISHKLFRWLTAYFLILAFLSSLCLINNPLFAWLFAAQAGFYLLALLGFAFDLRSVYVPLVSTIYSFCAMNSAIFIGVTRALLGKRIFGYRS